MRVGICDDDKQELELACEVCKETFEQIKVEYEIQTFSNGEEFLQCNEEFHLLILDIEMPGMDGITIKRILQENNQKTTIIYVTNHDELVFDAFGCNVFAFVPKKDIAVKLPRYINDFVQTQDPWTILEGEYDSRDVKYIKAAKNYTEVYINKEPYRLVRKNIGKYEKLLSEYGYVRIHRSCLVNLAWVTRLTEDSVFIGDIQLHVAERPRKKVREKYYVYCRRKARYC